MKPQIVFIKNEFCYCQEWPHEPIYSGAAYQDTPAKSEYERAIIFALEKGIPFENQEKVSFLLMPKEFRDVDAVWKPEEGDHWDCPEGVEIEWQSNFTGKAWQRSTFEFDPHHIDTGLRKGDPMTRQVAIFSDIQEKEIGGRWAVTQNEFGTCLLEFTHPNKQTRWLRPTGITKSELQAIANKLNQLTPTPENQECQKEIYRWALELKGGKIGFEKFLQELSKFHLTRKSH